MTNLLPRRRILCIQIVSLLILLCVLLTSLAEAQGSDPNKVSTLVEQLKDRSRYQRIIAAEALGRMKEEAKGAVPFLIEALKDPEPEVRSSAALALGEIGEGAKEAVPQLIGALDDPDVNVRRSAARALAGIGEVATNAVPYLTRTLNDSDAGVRSNAVFAIGAIEKGSREAIPYITKALRDSDKEVRNSAARALGGLRENANVAVPFLIEALKDPEPEVRSSAALALGEIGEGAKEAVPQLIGALDDPDVNVRRSAAYSLDTLSTYLARDKDTEFSDQLNIAAAKMRSSPDTELRQHADRVQQAGDLLKLLWWDQLKQWLVTHPIITLLVSIYVTLPIIWLSLLWLRPLWLLNINEILSKVDIQLPGALGGLRLDPRHLLLTGLFHYHPKVLDAWVSKYISRVQKTFEHLATVEERGTYVPLPLFIDDEVDADPSPSKLRPIFSRNIICLQIWGEAGSGKTTLACQIARWAMSENSEVRLAQHLMLPVLIEQDVVVGHDEKAPLLLIAIKQRLRMTMDQDDPASAGFLRQLLKWRRLLVVVDGISEMSEASRAAVVTGITDLPVNAIILTSNTDEQIHGVPKTSIKPLRIKGNRLATFMEAYLIARERRDQFDDTEFFEACRRLSLLVNERDVTPLLAKLYAEQILAGKAGVTDSDVPANVPELMLSYLYILSRHAGPNSPSIRVIIGAVKGIAWECLKETFRPKPVLRRVVLSNLSDEIDEGLLHYLETRIGVIQTLGADRSLIRFSLEPVAEYLAATYLVDEYGDDERRWNSFLTSVDEKLGSPERAAGFLLAIRDCCLAKAQDFPNLTIVAEEIEERISNLSGLPPSDRTEKKPQFPLPIPPQEIVDACAAGECVLYGGSGMAAPAGFPTWQNFLLGLIKWSVQNNYIDRRKGNSFEESLRAGRADAVSDSIYNELQKGPGLSALDNYLRDVFLRDAALPDVYQIIKLMPLAAVLTTNFDELFEKAYDAHGGHVFTPRNAEQLKTALSKYQFFILKLYGSLSQPEQVMVAPAQFEDAVSRNRTFSEFMETLFFSRTILFIGASLEGIEAYLKGITLPQSIPRKHYALVAIKGNAWQAQADVLKRRYGIQVLPYTPSDDFTEVREFLENLVERVARKKTTTQEVNQKKARLQRVVLNNIGPFEHLELDLDSKWNILLGDNGVGKSTILKAIALAICGGDGQQYAKQLIKSGKESASIILETDRNTVYETQIYARSETAEVISKPARPLEIENWLVIGFPPLRTASWERPNGAEAGPMRRSTPSAEDVLPLLRGGLDPRMDKLKQWIVNLDYWKNRSGSENAVRYDKLIHEFFELVDHLTEDLKLTYKGIDESYGIRVATSDGEIPIESVSQGTTSLTGWVGILLQRLNEVYGHEEDPKSKYALVLLDEIDAHMHPAWQQTLVHRLGEKFTGLQFIATTHSPLIIGGMRTRQLFRFMRKRDGQVTQIEVDREMAMGRADQVLTSDLFGLDTTIDAVTQERVSEYQELLSMPAESRTKAQDLKLRRLREILGFRILNTGETAPERRAQELLQALLLEQFEDKFPEVQRQILDKGEKLFTELKKQEDLKQ